MTTPTLDAALARLAVVEAQRDRLAEALKGITACFVEHLSQEAHDKGIRIEELCPCYESDVANACAALDSMRDDLERAHDADCPNVG